MKTRIALGLALILACCLSPASADEAAGRLVQINFKFSVTAAEYEQAVQSMATPIAQVPGLRWKVWLMNEQEHEAGGIYLFDTESSANAYLNGPIVAAVLRHPALSDFAVRQFDALRDLSAVTRGPLR